MLKLSFVHLDYLDHVYFAAEFNLCKNNRRRHHHHHHHRRHPSAKPTEPYYRYLNTDSFLHFQGLLDFLLLILYHYFWHHLDQFIPSNFICTVLQTLLHCIPNKPCAHYPVCGLPMHPSGVFTTLHSTYSIMSAECIKQVKEFLDTLS
jgi:hypothetical protein